MAWGRLEDHYYDNPKMVRIGLAGTGLHSRAISYCNKHLTDGRVETSWVQGQLAADPHLTRRARAKVVESLVTEGAFEPIEGGYLVHDFLRFHPSRKDVEARRESDRKRKGVQDGSGGNPNGIHEDASRARRARAGMGLPVGVSFDVSEDAREVDRLCALLAELIRDNDPKAKPAHESKRWRDAMRLLLERDERSPEEVEVVIRWCQADSFWQSNILSAPKLREKFSQLAIKAKAKGGQSNGRHPADEAVDKWRRRAEEWAKEDAAA